MLKKVILIVLSLMIASCLFAGCQFVDHDDVRDYRQVVATIAPVKDDLFEGGSSGTRYIYKYELADVLWQQYQGTETAPTHSDVTNILKELVKREMLYIEIELEYLRGNIVWRDGELTDGDGETYYDYTDANAVRKVKFDFIDSSLTSIKNTILQERGMDTSGNETPIEEPEPQYPVREPEESDEIEPEEEIYMPESSRIPTKYGDEFQVSLEKQAAERLVANILTRVKSGYQEYDSSKLAAAEEAFKILMDKGDYESLYLSLPDSYPIELLIGKSIERQTRMEAYQQKLIKEVEVSELDIVARYNTLLNNQKRKFASGSAYSDALSSGTELILYRPNSDYFYVRHILVPFSDEQTAQLNEYKASGKTKTEIENFRNITLFESIVAYPHPDGNNLESGKTTAKAVFNEVYAAVSEAAADLASADRVFTDKIYLYNTDTGAFANMNGYAMDKVFDPDSRQFMEEFELAAEDLLNNYKPGDVYPEPVITDYGMHIMYYAQDTVANTVYGLSDYDSISKERTVREVIEEQIRTPREGNAFSQWQKGVLDRLFGKSGAYTIFEKRYETV